MSGRDQFQPVAGQVFFDPSNCDTITQENVQGAIEDLCTEIDNTASPGFTWGRSGNLPTDTWLLNDTVPSNKAGRTVMLSGVSISNIFVASEELDTYDLTIYEHDGNELNLSVLVTVSVVATRAAQYVVNVPLTTTKQLAAKVTSGSAKNLVAGCVIKGNS